MSQCESSILNGIITIAVSGNITSANAEDTEQEINALLQSEEHVSSITLDFEKLVYLSSAGLRILLRMRRRYPDMKIINVSSEVYEILDMTGLAEMIEVHKAYRQMDLTGCEVIGEGSNGIVYRYSDDIIVKVYRNNDALADIQRERELARTALILGVNTAISYDVVKVGDQYGSVFENLSAKSLTKLILADEEHLPEYVQVMSDMLKKIHSTQVKPGTLPNARQIWLSYANFIHPYLDPEHGAKLLRLIRSVPYSNNMIHGDYHTNNVHYDGEAILIDMDTLAVGNPVFEFASIFLTYQGFNELDPNSSARFMHLDREFCSRVWSELLADYFDHPDDITKEALINKFRVAGYTRLLRRTIRRTPEEIEQIQYLREKLVAAIDRVDNLAL